MVQEAFDGAKLGQEWVNARAMFLKSQHQSQRNVAVKLDKAFFQQQEDLR